MDIGAYFLGLLMLAAIAGAGFIMYVLLANRGSPAARIRAHVCAQAPSISPFGSKPEIAPLPESVRTPVISHISKLENLSNTTELIERLRSIDWFQFEKIVGLTYKKLGYSVVRRGGANPDGGIDLVIEKDGERVAVQCKQWKAWVVRVKTVREFLGALTDSKLSKGILVTLRGYTSDAKELADKHRIELITEMRLAAMLETTNARFDPETLEILRDTRKFCPKCEREMVLRPARKGRWAGQDFWGCSGFPRCRYILRLKPSTEGVNTGGVPVGRPQRLVPRPAIQRF